MTISTDRPPPEPVLPRRFLRPFLLLTLAASARRHGYELFETVTRLGVAVDLAGVYRDLRTMEQRDLVTSHWLPSELGPDRRVYELTTLGVEHADAAAAEMSIAHAQLGSALDALGLTDDDARPVGAT